MTTIDKLQIVSRLTKEQAEELAKHLTNDDDDGWTYKAESYYSDYVVAIYDEGDMLLGYL